MQMHSQSISLLTFSCLYRVHSFAQSLSKCVLWRATLSDSCCSTHLGKSQLHLILSKVYWVSRKCGKNNFIRNTTRSKRRLNTPFPWWLVNLFTTCNHHTQHTNSNTHAIDKPKSIVISAESAAHVCN